MYLQLERIVAAHRALSDPARIRILCMLADGPLHGQAIAGRLGVTAPTVTHHMSKLREAGFVRERRDKNTIYFTLDERNLRHNLLGTLQLVLRTEAEKGGAHSLNHADQDLDRIARQRYEVISNFFTPDGRLKHLPAKQTKKLFVLEHMLRGLQVGRKYSEREINEHILQYHDDYATIRREFIMHQYMYRENGTYELNPRELWPHIG